MDSHPERPSDDVQALLAGCQFILGPKGDLHGVLRLIEELRFYVTEAMIASASKREMQEEALRQRIEEEMLDPKEIDRRIDEIRKTLGGRRQ